MFVCLKIPSFYELLRKYCILSETDYLVHKIVFLLVVSVAQLCRYILLYGLGGSPFLHYNVQCNVILYNVIHTF